MKELTGGEVYLTEKGTEDWYYPSYNNGARKENGSMIQADSLTYYTVDNLGTAGDYKAEIVLSDTEKTRNFHFSAYLGISVELPAGTHTVYVYGTAWKASYRFEVTDCYGKILSNITAQATTSDESHAYEYAVTLNVPEGGGTYTFRIEPIELNGGNVGLAAVAVA